MSPSVNTEERQPRTIRLRTVLIISFILMLLTALAVAGAMSMAFLIGKNATPSIEQQRQTVVQEGEVIEEIAQKVGRSVVSIVTERQSTGVFGSGPQGGAGTGVILDDKGLIITNRHVVPQGTSRVRVVAYDGTVYDSVRLVGRDPLNDLAILKVNNPKNFVPATLGDSDKVRTGQKVIAIGNALGQFQNTVTSGIISGMGRPVTAGDSTGANVEQLSNLFQTDAAINSGNSGGPLLDFNGAVIGINTAVAADAQNIGFAIPINEAKVIIESAKETGKVSRPYLGVRYVALTPALAQQLEIEQTQGAYISDERGAIVSGGPADKAGIRQRDIITKVGTIELDSRNSLTSAISRHKVGDTVNITIIRGGQARTISVELAEAPSNN